MKVHIDDCWCVKPFVCMKQNVGTWRSCLVFWSGLTLLRPAVLAFAIDESVMRTVVCGRGRMLFRNCSLERETLIKRISGDWKYRRNWRQAVSLLSYKLGFSLRLEKIMKIPRKEYPVRFGHLIFVSLAAMLLRVPLDLSRFGHTCLKWRETAKGPGLPSKLSI